MCFIVVVALSGRRCTSNEYTCSNGQCINRDRVCDGLSDCQDGGDERGCIQGIAWSQYIQRQQ